jgi:hypothetical protein
MPLLRVIFGKNKGIQWLTRSGIAKLENSIQTVL